MSAEKVVHGYLVDIAGPAGAEFLLGCLKEEWLTGEAEKSECAHPYYRSVYNETGVWNRCDTCGAINV